MYILVPSSLKNKPLEVVSCAAIEIDLLDTTHWLSPVDLLALTILAVSYAACAITFAELALLKAALA
jgi:hypothetical protein